MMTDREEFEKWYKENSTKIIKDYGFGTFLEDVMFSAWQARGELDAVRIKELEADAKRWNYFIETCSEEIAFYITGITGNVTNEQINDSIDAEMLRIGVE